MLRKRGYAVVVWAVPYVTALALVPFAGMSVSRYFVDIGFRYLAMFSTPVAVGAMLQQYSSRPLECGKAA